MHFPLFKTRRCQGTRTKDYDDDNGDLQRGIERNEGPPGGLAEDSSGVLQIHTGGSSEISSATGLYVGKDGEVDILGRMDQPIYQGAPDSSSTPKKQAIEVKTLRVMKKYVRERARNRMVILTTKQVRSKWLKEHPKATGLRTKLRTLRHDLGIDLRGG